MISPGKTSYCVKEIEEGFEFLHPLTTCPLSSCGHYFICQKWIPEKQANSSSCAQQGAILSISQSVGLTTLSQSEKSRSLLEVYSPSVMGKQFSNQEINEILNRQKQEQERIEQQLTPAKDTPADFPVVGSGTAHPLCGTKIIKGCLEDHPAKELNDIIDHQKDLNGKCMDQGAEIHIFKCSCHRPLCPICNGSWKKRAVSRVWERFVTYGKSLTPEEKKQRKLCHILISAPKTMYHQTMPEMQKSTLTIAKQLNVDAGTIIYHSKRQIEQIKGNWTYENTYFSPHFHIFTPLKRGWINGDKVAKIHDKTGFVIVNFGQRDLKRNISYQLGHAGVPTNHSHIVKWFGEMNYRKLHVEKYVPTQATCSWGHKLDRHVVYIGKDKNDKNPIIDQEPGYVAIVPKEGWLYLPKKRKKERNNYSGKIDPYNWSMRHCIIEDPGGG